MLLNIRFCNFLAVKSYAKSRSVNHFRVRAKIFSKTDASGIFEAIKKSPFLGANTFARPISENASAEIIAFARLEFHSAQSFVTIAQLKHPHFWKIARMILPLSRILIEFVADSKLLRII